MTIMRDLLPCCLSLGEVFENAIILSTFAHSGTDPLLLAPANFQRLELDVSFSRFASSSVSAPPVFCLRDFFFLLHHLLHQLLTNMIRLLFRVQAKPLALLSRLYDFVSLDI